MITYIFLLHAPSLPPSAADTNIFLSDIIQASTHDKISSRTLHIAGTTVPCKAPRSLPQARPFITFHQYNASLLLLTIDEWHKVTLLY
jgi:hypothetical protein